MTAIKQDILNLPKIENLEQKIAEIRSFIFEEYEKNKHLYDEIEIERVRLEDWTVERYIRARKTVKHSAEMLNNTLKWRNEYQLCRLKESDFPEEFYKMGAMFGYSNDKLGNGVVYSRLRRIFKIKELEREFKQFIMYQIDKMDRQTNGTGMAVVIDCQEAGLNNLDMDLIWFVVTSFLKYVPYGLNYFLIYEMPWIMASAWNMIKGWIPIEAAKKIKFAYKNEIFDYIDKENLPFYLGGTCKINYMYVPKTALNAYEFGEMKGLSKKTVNRIMKFMKPHLEDADREMKMFSKFSQK